MGLVDFLKTPKEKKVLKTFKDLKNLLILVINLIFLNSFSQVTNFSDLNEKTVNEFLTKKEGFVLQHPYSKDAYKVYSSKQESNSSIFNAEIYFKNEYPLQYDFSLYQYYNKNDDFIKELKYELVKSLFDDEIKFIKGRNIQFEELTDSKYLTKKYTINDIDYIEKGEIGEKDDYYFFNRERSEILDINKYPLLKLNSGDDKFNILNVSTYNITDMIKLFIKDLKFNINIFENNNLGATDSKKILKLINDLANIQIKAIFEEMDNEILAVSYGINNDENILLKVNPIKWAEASNQKKWYIIYHELGHDVLNLLHGEGDKMMFNFIDKKYTWTEFFDDRKKMFDIYFSKKILKTNSNLKNQVTSINNSIRTVKICEQEWATKNLSVSKYKNGDIIPEIKDPKKWIELTTGAWCYYNNDPKNEAVFGKLYNWYAVNDPRGLVPEGFHIPSTCEWGDLTEYLGGNKIAGLKLKSKSKKWKHSILLPNNKSGFSANPAGQRNGDGKFYGIGNITQFWSSEQYSSTRGGYENTRFATIYPLNYENGYISEMYTNKTDGLSIRCLKDKETVRIDKQIWATKNLNVSTYRNGDEIPEVKDPNEWSKITYGAWCYYNNDYKNGPIYGKLYNSYAVNDPRGLAPAGYHIPSDIELKTMYDYFGGQFNSGGYQLREENNKHWKRIIYSNNCSGFTALPGGIRTDSGEFWGIGSRTKWLCSLGPNSTVNKYFEVSESDSFSIYPGGLNSGFSIRCIKD
jgi:uncharacterized protein (TIGR02145 family)